MKNLNEDSPTGSVGIDKTGLLHDMGGEIFWDNTKDIEYYQNIHNEGTSGEERRNYMIERIEQAYRDFIGVIDHSLRFLRRQPSDLDEDALCLLNVEGRLKLLRSLIVVQSNELPASRRLNYLFRFEDDLNRCCRADTVHNGVIFRCLLDLRSIWLRELVDANDCVVGAWMTLDESMSCEHKGYVGWFTHQHSLSLESKVEGSYRDD